MFIYLVRNDVAGYIRYIGSKSTLIEYNPVLKKWQMRSIIDPSVSASNSAPFHTLSLGAHTWQVNNDSKCQKGMAKLTLTLSSCKKTEFICNNGLCVDLEKRCNGSPDCKVMFAPFVYTLFSFCKNIAIRTFSLKFS